MNGGGIPPAAQQVFAVLICPGRRGRGATYPDWGEGYLPWLGGQWVPTLAGGYIPWPGGGGTYPGQGDTYPGWGEGIPTLARGEGIPTLARGGSTYPGQGDTYPGWGEGIPTLARGIPTLAGGRGYLPWPGGVPTLAGVPPPGCGQTDACENSTFPHPSDAGGKKECLENATSEQIFYETSKSPIET